MSQDPSSPAAGFARLGAGGRHDRLGFRLVVAILWRCVGLLRPVRAHVLALAAGFSALALVGVPVALWLFDLFWTRALQGEPLTAAGADLLGLAHEVAVEVDALSQETRRHVARRAIAIGLVVFGSLSPAAIGLYYYQVWILQRINQLLRLDLLGRLQHLSLRFHAESRVGDAIYRLYQDSAMVTQLIEVLFLTPLFALSRYLFTVAALALYDPWLAVVLALLWVPALLLGQAFSQPLRANFRAAREANAALASRIQETLTGIRVIKAYGAEPREQARFETQSRDAFARAFEARSRLALFGVATFWLVGASLLAMTAWATHLTREQALLLVGASLAGLGLSRWNLGLYNAAKFLAGSGVDQVRQIFRTWGRVQDIAIGLDRVFELLDLEPEVQEAPDAVDLPPVQRGVAFRGVAFRYQEGRPALEDVDLEGPVGSVTAIVGPTGAGKSTLVALLLRLFDPDRGSIEIDGLDLRRVRLGSLRARVAIALQENVLFGTTIRENIRYAVPDADDAAVRAAARVACADEFIEALPDGYDTLLGERGAKLSTGQRQRLSIARSVLKDPDVLVLDEPTASLDAETEQRVLRRLAAWGERRTIFLITHRLSTVRQADRIVVLREGRIVERGDHGSLMALPGGVYRGLVESESPAEPDRARATR